MGCSELSGVFQIRPKTQNSEVGADVECLGATVLCPEDTSPAMAQLSIKCERVRMLTARASNALKADTTSIAHMRKVRW